MAFSDESKLHKCGREGCCNRRAYFRMIESRRDQDTYMGEGIDEEEVTRYRRICEECELQSRNDEFPGFPARFRDKYPNYCDPQAVHKTIRHRAKGDSWRMFPKKVKAAKAAINERKAKGEHMARQETKKAVNHLTAQEMAGIIAAAVRDGTFFGILSAAGEKMKEIHKHAAHHEEMLKSYLQCGTDEEGHLRQMYDVSADELAKLQDYIACHNKGEEKEQFLKSLDFLDAITDNVRLFNVCRRRNDHSVTRADGRPGTCGLAFPSKLWEKIGEWKFNCRCNWQALLDAHEKQPDDPILDRHVTHMQRHYGDVTDWPRFGCGCKFIPYKFGRSMVMEIKCPDGTW